LKKQYRQQDGYVLYIDNHRQKKLKLWIIFSEEE